MKKLSEKIVKGFNVLGLGLGIMLKMFMNLATGIFEAFNEEPKKKKRKRKKK